MTNGTFAPPLAGEYFRNKWFGLTVRPPPPLRFRDNYANIVAYVLEVNGFKAANAKLPAGRETLGKMTIG